MSVDSAEFRRILGHWSTGVAVVTSVQPDGSPCGMTANAVCSVSLDPPLVLVCLERTSDTHQCVVTSGVYAINMLAQEDERLARHFAAEGIAAKFEGIAYQESLTGAAVLEDALAWVDCRVHARYDGGDHSVFVGTVVAGDASTDGPLLYYRGGYARLVP